MPGESYFEIVSSLLPQAHRRSAATDVECRTTGDDGYDGEDPVCTTGGPGMLLSKINSARIGAYRPGIGAGRGASCGGGCSVVLCPGRLTRTRLTRTRRSGNDTQPIGGVYGKMTNQTAAVSGSGARLCPTSR